MLTSGCSTLSPTPVKTTLAPESCNSFRLGYTIQAGAFTDVEHAARLSRTLEKQGLNAYYFRHSSGLYKVRFGNYPSLQEATRQAENYLRAGTITDYYLVRPDSYALAKKDELGEDYLREQLLDTAADFLGIRYKWGGASQEDGFDCSGLVMAVYQLNGLDLPRTSKSQFHSGKPVAKNELKKGDLVFFATRGGKRITHVGIYAGNNSFIHAPRKGKQIETSSLSSSYFASRFMGARTYLGDS
ncbi:MAG: C40 family peptidase [Proteobacteria bacterium]|nr:C40 family peptidase [Pseudomonadota bacterium]